MRASPIDVEEAAQPGVRVDEPEPGRRHAELHVLGGDRRSQCTAQLQAAADRRAAERGDHGQVGRGERVERGGERVGDEPLGFAREDVGRDVGDVVARGEGARLAGQQQRARAAVRRPRTCSAIASRIAWSSALCLAGLEITSRRTPSAGSSTFSSPGIGAAI